MAPFAASMAARPLASTSTVARGFGAAWWKMRAASCARSSTDSVMRSWMAPRRATSSATSPDQGVPDATLDAPDLGQPAVVGDVGRLRRPRRDGPEPRHDEQAPAGQGGGLGARAVMQQPVEHAKLLVGERFGRVHEVGELGADLFDRRIRRLDLLEAFGQPGESEGRGAAKYDHAHRETAGKSCASGSGLQPGSTPWAPLTRLATLGDLSLLTSFAGRGDVAASRPGGSESPFQRRACQTP